MSTAVGSDLAGPFADEDWRADLASLADSAREASRTFAADAVLIASLAARIPRFAHDDRGSTHWTSFLREVAVARRITDRAATADVAIAVDLIRRCPTALGLLEEGRLPVAQCRALVEETMHCDDGTARSIDEELAVKACSLATWRVRQEVQRMLVSIDADAAAARAARATADRDVQLTPLRDDQAGVFLSGPAVALTAWFATLDTAARALRAAGDPRTLAQLRFDLAVAHGTTCASPVPAPAPAPAPASAPASTPEPAAARMAGWDWPWTSSPAAPTPAPPAPSDLTADLTRYSDCRLARPVQMLIHVPVTTALGLSNEPGWLEGCGWISAPQVRQLLPVAELRQVCTTASGQVVDLADRVTRPPPTPGDVRAAVVAMATRPFDITDKTWRTEPRHDPSPSLDRFVAVRDRFCDGPTQPRVRAEACDDDHKQPYPDGPTAAWNLAARARRTHGLKHFGWTDIPTPTGTLWISPAGQLVQVDRYTPPQRPLSPDAELPGPDRLHQLEAELLRELGPDELPPLVPPRGPASDDPPPF